MEKRVATAGISVPLKPHRLARARIIFVPIVAGLAALAASRLFADDYQGADVVLRQANATVQKANPTLLPPSEGVKLREDLKAFRDSAATMPPEEVARTWLGLLLRAIQLSQQPDAAKDSSPVYIQEVYLAVPPPSAWDALAKEINSRPAPTSGPAVFPAQALRVLAATLQGDRQATRAAVDALGREADRPEEIRKEVSAKDHADGFYEVLFDVLGSSPPHIPKSRRKLINRALFGVNARDLVRRLRDKIPGPSDPQEDVKEFEQKLAALPPVQKPRDAKDDSAPQPETLSVPDLVPTVGAERAEAMLRQVFVSPKKIAFSCDEQTKTLARRVALEMAGQLKFAPWDLADRLDSVELYEVLTKRFPLKEKENPSWDQENAAGYALAGLAIQGRDTEANWLALQLARRAAANDEELREYLSDSILHQAIYQGHGLECVALLERLLRAHPEAPAWESYGLAARLTAQLEPALALMKLALDRGEIKGKAEVSLRDVYAHTLLAAGHGAEGAVLLRDLDLPEPKADDEFLFSLVSSAKERAKRLGKLAELAHLLGDKTLLNQTLDALVKDDAVGGDLTRFFLEAGRGPEMERLLSKWLAEASRKYQEDQMPDRPAYNRLKRDTILGPAFSLVEFYDLVGRPQDIVKLFDQGRFWPAEDVAGLMSRVPGGGNDFGYQTAHALAQVGRLEEARRTLDAFLDFSSGCEGAYSLLLELLPPELAALKLAELQARDGVDGEPMLWRARVLLVLGRLEEAERSVRQALAVIPFDTDSDTRAQAWRVLAEIQTRRGDPAASATTQRAAAESQLARGDELTEADLFSDAVAAFQHAHDTFGDDYSVEWDLAQALGEVGRLDEAEQHYRHACELVPTSLGRRSLHYWMDADKLINFARIQTMAIQVLTPLTTSAGSPEERARAHFALGWILRKQDHDAESLREMQAAVQLDPDFFDAWNAMPISVASDTLAHERRLNLLRLDPQRRHALFADHEPDLRELWRMLASVLPYYPRPPADLYPFGASRAALTEIDWSPARRETTLKVSRVQGAMDPEWKDGAKQGGFLDEEMTTPAAVVMSDSVIELTSQLLGVAAPYNSGQFDDRVESFDRGRPYH